MGVLLLVRHGQASLGAADYDQLSPLGRRQAQLIGDRLAKGSAPVSRVLSGKLLRQRDTAHEIARAVGATVEVDGRWNEYDHVNVLAENASAFVFTGDTHELKDGAAAALDQAIQRWIRSPAGYIESHASFLARVRAAVTAAQEWSGINVVVTSGGVIAAACTELLGLDNEQWPRLARVIVNTSVTKVITGRSGTSLVSFNDHAHLEATRDLTTYR